MKRAAGLLLIFCCLISKGWAQLSPQYTQYSLNGFLLNPAIAGIENYIDLRLGNRAQWKGLEGAPNTRYVTVHAPLGKEFLYDNANSFSGQGDHPMNRSYVQTYQAAAPHHGIGLKAFTDQTGPLKRTDINLSYAYHLGISEQLNVSVGVSAGIMQMSLDGAALLMEDPSDPALVNYARNRMVPDASAGIWVYGPRFFGGLAVHNLLKNEVRFINNSGTSNGSAQSQFFLNAGYKVYLADDLAAFPSIMVSYINPLPVNVEGNVKIAFRDKFWLGGGYRRDDSFSATAGFNLGHLFNVGYSYDFTTSKLNTVSRGTHEIVLGILLNNRYRVTCPQKNW